ncbi:hypothetical protein ACFQ3N_01390 [Virgibacillus byunsanensis]|uniref:N-acetyltransferase domain-containing protein n=1 Tax=Virgibacillus byunsanensis TaxID=570945 RepID=A0ABW3LFD5_9BACI
MIINIYTGETVDICYKVLGKSDVKKYNLYKKNGWFEWTKEFAKKENKLFGMFVKGKDVIQGVIAIQEHKNNQLIHIELMEAAPQNKFSNPNQTYAGIGKNLLCFAVELSFQLNYEGYIGLFAKRNQNEDYYRKLGAIQSRFNFTPYYFFPTNKSAELHNRYLPGGVQWCQS